MCVTAVHNVTKWHSDRLRKTWQKTTWRTFHPTNAHSCKMHNAIHSQFIVWISMFVFRSKCMLSTATKSTICSIVELQTAKASSYQHPLAYSLTCEWSTNTQIQIIINQWQPFIQCLKISRFELSHTANTTINTNAYLRMWCGRTAEQDHNQLINSLSEPTNSFCHPISKWTAKIGAHSLIPFRLNWPNRFFELSWALGFQTALLRTRNYWVMLQHSGRTYV